MNRMRLTKSKRNSKRSHHGMTDPAYTTEGETLRLRHRGSRLTGSYRGKKILEVKQRSEKEQKKSAGGEGEKKTVEQVTAPA